MKKLIFLFILLLLFLSYNKKEIYVFNEVEDNTYKNYTLTFNNCILNTSNFISNFNFFVNKDFKILELVPDSSYDEKYLYYSSNIENIIKDFKNKYINNLIDNSKYSNEVCIKKVRINTSNYDLYEFKNRIDFSTNYLD